MQVDDTRYIIFRRKPLKTRTNGNGTNARSVWLVVFFCAVRFSFFIYIIFWEAENADNDVAAAPPFIYTVM